MRIKIAVILMLFFFIINEQAFSQENQKDSTINLILKNNSNPQLVNNLAVLGKVWGFLKYYHPVIAGGKFDLDKELIDFLPAYCNAVSINDRNHMLEEWIGKFGSFEPCLTCSKKDFSLTNLDWIKHSKFSKKIKEDLLYLKSNKQNIKNIYVSFDSEDGVNYPSFENEKPYTNLVFPNSSYSLLSLFRFWNFIEYWYPYKDASIDWDNVLINYIPFFIAVPDQRSYYNLLQKLIVKVKDSHGYLKSNTFFDLQGSYYMPFTVKMIHDSLLITSSLNENLFNNAGLKITDMIESINNTPIKDIVDSLHNYIPASNIYSFNNSLSYWITRSFDKETNLTINSKGKRFKTTVQNFKPAPGFLVGRPNLKPAYFSYQKDTAFCKVTNDIIYINIGNFKQKDSTSLKEMVLSSRKMIIDNRQNQDELRGTGGGYIVAQLVLPHNTPFVKYIYPDTTFPGIFLQSPPTNVGLNIAEKPFAGEIIILINENTMSVGEFNTMADMAANNSKTLGSITSGTNGGLSYIILPGGVISFVTGIGVMFPNGKIYQRTGIVPDIKIEQTALGYFDHKDEQLEAAIEYLKSTH